MDLTFGIAPGGGWEYLVLFGVVYAINLLPAFGPPTWSIIVLYGLNTQMPAPGIVLVGALAAGAAPDGIRTVEIEDLPLAYLPGNSLRVRVRVVGDVA